MQILDDSIIAGFGIHFSKWSKKWVLYEQFLPYEYTKSKNKYIIKTNMDLIDKKLIYITKTK